MNMTADQEILTGVYSKHKFAKSWADLQDGMKVKLVTYDHAGFIQDRSEWIDCVIEIVPGQDRPKLYDADRCTWHDCLYYPYELEILK